ncbi:hypothetical protein DYBT9275_03543 [Dyadobacter sp. CECT 9275]|uniref:N-acetyltransferase domain-containing protein n=1 Tax=Dyadobacter helix TaxID=2822344 RepID=A0A916JEA6_9BACT|nr:GNAT family N-acetyltransferase [Dyadobacter sp. CECT 9275]CAG5005231.1 hypothetical protein DYBT9275_03543 [Dyadobacter sp. CECT 9275]
MTAYKIYTRHYVLTKMKAEDGEKYFRLCGNENVMKFVTGHALTRTESDKMLAEFVKDDDGKSYFGRYFIEDRGNGDLIGAAKLDKEGRAAEIGYRIQEEYWGKGVATEIAKELIQFSLEKLKMAQVTAFVNVENYSSIRVLEKAGMKRIETIEDIDEIKHKFIYSTQNQYPMKKVFYAIFALIAIILIAAFLMPKEYGVEKEIVINKARPEVFNFLKSLENQEKWSVWAKLDPAMKKEYKGNPGTVGSVYRWEGNDQVGVGEQEIKKIIEGERIDTELRFIKPIESTSDAYLITESRDSTQTLVKWGFKGSMPIPMNIMIPFLGIEKSVGEDFENGLKNLKTLLESN